MLRVAEHYAGSDTGRQRRANEDSLLARSPLFVVADGMGGAQAGEVASRIAVESFEQGLEEGSTPELALATLATAANARIHELSQAHADQAGMGTTLTAIYVGEEEVTIAHVGDSRAYYFRDAELHRLTDDHSLVDELIRQGRLTPEEAADHPQRSVITRALGPEVTVEVDTRSFRARDRDVYLICSDGLTTMVAEERIAELLGAPGPLRDTGERLIAAANEAGGRDNITVILLRLEEIHRMSPADLPRAEHETVSGAPPEDAALSGAGAGLPAAPPGGSGAEAPPSAPAVALMTRSAGENAKPVTPRRPRPGTAATAGGGRSRRLRRLRRATALLVTLIILGLLGSAAYLATQSIYFIGTNSRGLVTIYNGLPYRLPGGIALYTTTYVSGVAASTIAPERRRTLLDHSLRSESQAASLIRSLERGQLE